MGFELLLQGTATAVSVGMGCGTCCSPSISLFLSGYTITHSKNIKQSFLAFASFYLGKIMAVTTACMGASIAGQAIISENGSIGNICIQDVVSLFMLCLSGILIGKWMIARNDKKFECRHCSCSASTKKNVETNYGILWGMGIGYGISPCAPLIMMLGYAATQPLGYAVFCGMLFAIASSLSPMIVLFALSGILSEKIKSEIPQYMEWFRLASYLILFVISIYAMI